MSQYRLVAQTRPVKLALLSLFLLGHFLIVNGPVAWAQTKPDEKQNPAEKKPRSRSKDGRKSTTRTRQNLGRTCLGIFTFGSRRISH